MKSQGPEAEGLQSGQDAHRTNKCQPCPGTGQTDQCHSSSAEAQDTGRPCYEDSRGTTKGKNTSPFPKMSKYICVPEN